MQRASSDSFGRFHLKDGRRLVFYPIRQSGLRRHTGEALAVAFVLMAAAVAATLLAASHAPRRPPRPLPPAVAIRESLAR